MSNDPHVTYRTSQNIRFRDTEPSHFVPVEEALYKRVAELQREQALLAPRLLEILTPIRDETYAMQFVLTKKTSSEDESNVPPVTEAVHEFTALYRDHNASSGDESINFWQKTILNSAERARRNLEEHATELQRLQTEQDLIIRHLNKIARSKQHMERKARPADN